MANRTRVSRSFPIDSDGNKADSPLDAVGVKFEFFDTDWVKPDNDDKAEPPVLESRVILIADLESASPEDVSITNGLAIHGLKALVGESYASREKAGKLAWDMADERIKTLMAGEWQEGRGESIASSSTLIVEAICRVLEKGGFTVTDEVRAKCREQTSTKEQRAAALKRADINAAYRQIRAEREQAAADKAAAAAAAASEGSLADAFGLAD